MVLYLGKSYIKKIIIDKNNYYLPNISKAIITPVLLSLDNFILKDKDGIYLIPKKESE